MRLWQKLIPIVYLHKYLQNSNFIFSFVLFFCRIPVFMRFSGPFISFSLVYTNILEQKRIAGQVQNTFILILFSFF